MATSKRKITKTKETKKTVESDFFAELDKEGNSTMDLYDRGRKGISAKITLCDAFVIYAKVVEGKNGLFLSYPSFKTKDGDYVNQAYCFDTEINKSINEALNCCYGDDCEEEEE